MAIKEFERLIEKRKDWVRSSKENNFDFDSILAGLYNDPSHFIYEILQNAEDANAKEVKFELFEDRLSVYHNGKDFDLKDIDGVTGIGISTKKDDLNLIGKFGVGFKSVFAVTETPYIFSGEYRIKIKDFVIPSVDSDSEQVDGTLIRLPFNHKTRSPKEVSILIAHKLENIGLKTLLFLKNIEEIKWQTPSSSGHYLKSSDGLQSIPNTKKVAIISSSVTEDYIVIERPIKIEGKELKVEIAYKLGKDKNGKEIIVQEPDSKLVVFFPTEKVTFLNFVVQGPYKTTPNRENIPLDDEQNKAIIEQTGCLVAESFPIIKDLGYLDTNFLNLLPINPKHKENEPIYSAIYEKVKEKFLSNEELLPTCDGNYTKASDALLSGSEKLTEFLNEDDIQMLFDKKRWLDTNITDANTRELRSYLMKELEIPEIDFENFARKITAEFLRTKSDEWMIDFYSRLLEQQSLWSDRGYSKGILRTKPIIRLETNEHITPFDSEGKVQVYLPAEAKSEYKTVKRSLTDNQDALKFLNKLGLTKPDLFAEIKEFILPKYKTANVVKDEEYFEDFEKLLSAYETIPSGKKKEFINQLSDMPFIDSINYVTQEKVLRKPSEVYLSNPELRKYFQDNSTIYFVSDELVEKFTEEKVKPFLLEIGVVECPRRIEIDTNLSWEKRLLLRGNTGHTYDISQKDYDYEGLNLYIDKIDSEKSFLLWTLLLKNIKDISSSKAKEFFKGEYKWKFFVEYSKLFDAKFLITLKQKNWLVDKNDNFSMPSDITRSELSDQYLMDSPNIDILIKELGFKPDVIEQLPEEDKKKYQIVKGYSAEELEKIISAHEKKSEEGITKEGKEPDKWTPEVNPDEVETVIEEMTPEKIVISVKEGQTGEGEANGKGQNGKDIDKKKTETLSHSDKKKIGAWGEEFVLNGLRNKFMQEPSDITETEYGFKVVSANNEEVEIVWLNKHSDRGEGCDLIIKQNGAEIEYIEVKTKTHSDEELIEITGKQWESARSLFDKGEGAKYSIYVISNAGQSDAKIKKLNNPIKLWKDGKLYAHPIKFKI